MSDLRDPNLDTDYVLDPTQLVEFERLAEAERCDLGQVPATSLAVMRRWISAEMEVARQRALAVDDHDFIECLKLIERRLLAPGSYLTSARAAVKIKSVLETRSRFRVIAGGSR